MYLENGEYDVYSPQIETQYFHWIKTSLVAKDLVFWDLKAKARFCDTFCFLFKMTCKEKSSSKKQERTTHDKSKISNLDQVKLFKNNLTKCLIKWIEAWSSIDSIIILVVPLFDVVERFSITIFFSRKVFNNNVFLFWGKRYWTDYFVVLYTIQN